jgi:hypothetical protein
MNEYVKKFFQVFFMGNFSSSVLPYKKFFLEGEPPGYVPGFFFFSLRFFLNDEEHTCRHDNLSFSLLLVFFPWEEFVHDYSCHIRYKLYALLLQVSVIQVVSLCFIFNQRKKHNYRRFCDQKQGNTFLDVSLYVTQI